MAQGNIDSLKWVTLFDNMNAKAEAEVGGKAAKPEKKKAASKAKNTGINGVENTDVFHLPAAEGQEGATKATKKRLSIERIYQKKSQLEHILLRPDTYIGSVEFVTQAMWVYDDEKNMMVQREINIVPGLYKIFDEVLVNAADNKQRDPKMNCIKIDIDPDKNMIRIWNNGRGIPVVEHKTENMYVPTMIFGHLLTSSNYDDTEKKVTGGRNGYGAKLCNIFSTKFMVETSAKEYRKSFKQTWQDNMGKTKEPIIIENKPEDFTCVTFFPDLSKFKMEKLDDDIVALFTRRAYDIAASGKGVKVILNGKRIALKGFRDYVDLFIKEKVDETGQPLKVVYEAVNDRWEVAVTQSEKGFQQASFVNSIATTKGGRHVDYITDQIVSKLIESVKKKNKGGIAVKPFQVKNHLWVFVNCLIENPTFDSQTKENMTLQLKSFGSKCPLSEKFITQVNKCGIIESILSWMKFKAQAQLNKKCHASKHSKLKGIPKLDDANDAGTKGSKDCTLILTEGDSAKTLAVAGLGVVGRDKYGVFPLRGKLLNVREATHKQIMDNAEINNIIKIMGLHFKEKYDSPEAIKGLRYGKIMIMTDQDQDGSHIKGLLINFIHHFWPSLLKHNVVEEFITPIVKVSKGKLEKCFYSLPEFEEWKLETDGWHTWKVKYYKGLGTSTAKEAKEYFSDMEKHRIPFHYAGTEDDASIHLAFSKKKIEERKEWLTNWMEERKRRAEMGLPELYLYGKNTQRISFNDFINRELILFSNMDNVRSIPGLVDGMKPGQRKVMFTCFKRNLIKELKVAQLAGSVAEISAYHHGEVSLMGTIINLAQNFVGSNNINLLQPIGQFGTRLHGGKDAASPRYIFTCLSTLARLLYNSKDDALLNDQMDDNVKIEPEWYCPIIPMVLVNGAEGIGTGWSTKIQNYDAREIIANIKRMLDGLEPLPMIPSFKNFKGTIEELGENRYIISGEVSIVDDETIEITELPIKTWTQNYKEDVLEPMLQGTDKTPPMITDYKEYHTDTTVKFQVKMTAEKLAQAEDAGLHKVFKLQTSVTTQSMVLFDHNNCIRRYTNVDEILREFFDVRMDLYEKRKKYMEGMLASESLKLDNIARFIMEKCDGLIVIENKPKRELIQTLVRRGYDSDPVKAWKEAQNKAKDVDEENDDDDASDASGTSGPDFNYILNLPLWSLTKERKEELCKQRDAKAEELSCLRKKSPSDLWQDDLELLLEELDKVEQAEKEAEVVVIKKPQKAVKGKSKPNRAVEETRPSPFGRRVEPRIDSAIKHKHAKDIIRKQKLKDKKAGKLADGQTDMLEFMKTEEGEEPLSLAERMKLKFDDDEVKKMEKPKKGAGRGRVKKEKDSPGSPKKVSPKKKGKKKNPWSDSDESDPDISDEEMDGSFLESVTARETAPRRTAAAKAKYNYDDEEEEEEGEDESNARASPVAFDKSDDEDSFKPELSDDDDDFTMKSKKKTAVPKPAPVKKPAPPAPPSPVISDISSDDDEEKSVESKTSKTNTDIFGRSHSPEAVSEPIQLDSDKEEDAYDWLKPKTNKPAPPKPAAEKPKPKKKPAGEKKEKKADPKQPGIASAMNKVPTRPQHKHHARILDSSVEDGAIVNDESDSEPSVSASSKQPSITSALSKAASKPKPKPQTKKLQPVVAINSSSDEDDDILSIASSTEKAPSKKRAPKKMKISDDEFSGDEKPKKKAAKRPAKSFDDSDVSEEEFKPKKKAPAKKKKKAFSDSEEEDSFVPETISVQPRERGGRAKPAVKYNFDESDDDFDDDY